MKILEQRKNHDVMNEIYIGKAEMEINRFG